MTGGPSSMAFDCLHGLSMGIVLSDPQSATIVYANEQAKTWFGHDLVGRSLQTAITAISIDDLRSRLASGKRYSITGEIAPAKGRRIAYLASASERSFGDGTFLVSEIEN